MKNADKLISTILCAAMVFSVFSLVNKSELRADEKQLEGKIIEFDEKADFKTSGSSSSSATSYYTVGKLNISGDYTETSSAPYSFIVNSGNLKLSFSLNESIRNATDTQWHVVSDGSKKLDDFELEDKVDEGAIAVMSSFDGSKWSLDEVVTDVFNKKKSLNTDLYETNDIQLVNGCYYKIAVLYQLERDTGNKSYVVLDETETKRIALVFEFYAESPDKVSDKASANDTPRKEMGTTIKCTKDKGFSDSVTIDKKDPHFGWSLGKFVVNGYTTEKGTDEEPVYMKNVGDRVRLWFVLDQDINKLNGDSDYQIYSDYNGYDQYFGVPATDFKRGTLIIRFTDKEGKSTDPIIYTDFLAADCQTKANTVVQLFEEGDYEVALDYEIVDKSGLGIPTYTNYKIFIKFKIRNSNCMVYPFDLSSGAELSDYDVAPNGFYLDTAKSKYLDVGIKKYAITEGSDGKLKKDERTNTAVKLSDEFTDEGVYEFTVSNKYMETETTKTIFVGTSPYILALSKMNNDIDEYNSSIDEGAHVDEDGTLVFPVETEVEETEIIVEETQPAEIVSETTIAINEPTVETTTSNPEIIKVEQTTENNTGNMVIIVLLIVLIVATLGVGVVVILLLKKKNSGMSATLDNNAKTVEKTKSDEPVSPNISVENTRKVESENAVFIDESANSSTNNEMQIIQGESVLNSDTKERSEESLEENDAKENMENPIVSGSEDFEENEPDN